MKTAISLPDHVFRSAEQLAARLGVSRSNLYCRALRELLDRQDSDEITARLNAVYSNPDDNAGLDPMLTELQHSAIWGRPRR